MRWIVTYTLLQDFPEEIFRTLEVVGIDEEIARIIAIRRLMGEHIYLSLFSIINIEKSPVC
jgi:hypothetical protein